MVTEAKKTRQDRGKIVQCLDLTYADRRKLVQSGARVSTIAEEYPCLMNDEEVSMVLNIHEHFLP